MDKVRKFFGRGVPEPGPQPGGTGGDNADTEEKPKPRVNRDVNPMINALGRLRIRTQQSSGSDKFGDNWIHRRAVSESLNPNESIDVNRDLNISNKFHMTPLHVAVVNNNIEMVSRLLDKNASLSVPGSDSVTLACIAAKFGYQDIIRMLARKDEGCIRSANSRGFSPAHEAARHDQVAMLRLLHELRVDLDFSTEAAGSPIDVALKSQSFGSLFFLRAPPRNSQAVDVIQGRHQLTMRDLNGWALNAGAAYLNDNRRSGIEDLRLSVQAIYIAGMNGDIDLNAKDAQQYIKSLFLMIANNILEEFRGENSLIQHQLYFMKSLVSICGRLGILNNDSVVRLNYDISSAERANRLEESIQRNAIQLNFLGREIQNRFRLTQTIFENMAISLDRVRDDQNRMAEGFVRIAKRLRNMRLAETVSSALKAVFEGVELAGVVVPLSGVVNLAGNALIVHQTRILLDGLREFQSQMNMSDEGNDNLSISMGDLQHSIQGTSLGEMPVTRVISRLADQAGDRYIASQMKQLSEELGEISRRRNVMVAAQ